MRYLVLSDVHANLEALDAVLASVDRSQYDRTLYLGDLVGYGANPNEVIDRIRNLEPLTVIRGNHDKVACGIETPKDFNPVARAAAKWTRRQLTPDHRTYLVELQAGPQLVDDLIEICHGTPYDEDAYVFGEEEGLLAFAVARRPVCLFGHTHVSLVLKMTIHGLEVEHLGRQDGALDRQVVALEPNARYLINPGSVGQPRDGDPRAAYAMVDTATRTTELVRKDYPVEAAKKKILQAGLPSVLARRLEVGR